MRIVLLIAASLLLACERTRPDPPSDTHPSPPSADTRPAPVLATPPLRLTLEAPARVVQGAVVPIRMVAHNTGVHPLVLETGDSAYTFNFVVTAPGGREVWSRMHRVQAIPLVRHERTIAPGQEIAFADNWELRDNEGRPVLPGKYLVSALLDADTMAYRMLRTHPHRLVIAPR